MKYLMKNFSNHRNRLSLIFFFFSSLLNVDRINIELRKQVRSKLSREEKILTIICL